MLKAIFGCFDSFLHSGFKQGENPYLKKQAPGSMGSRGFSGPACMQITRKKSLTT